MKTIRLKIWRKIFRSCDEIELSLSGICVKHSKINSNDINRVRFTLKKC